MRYSDEDSAPPAATLAAVETLPETPPAETVRTTPVPGDPVVLWGGRWWRAEILQTEGDQSLIRYVGYGSEWDEWITSERLGVYQGNPP